MTTSPTGDKKQIGLLPVGQAATEIMMEEERFDTESDAYRFGISRTRSLQGSHPITLLQVATGRDFTRLAVSTSTA